MILNLSPYTNSKKKSRYIYKGKRPLKGNCKTHKIIWYSHNKYVQVKGSIQLKMFVAFMLWKNVWTNRGLNNDENIYLIFLSLKEDTKSCACMEWGYVMNIEKPTLIYLSIYFTLSISIWSKWSWNDLISKQSFLSFIRFRQYQYENIF